MKKSLLLIALLAGAAHAEPTKEETVAFLQEKLHTFETHTIDPKNLYSKISETISYKISYSFEEISPCVFEYSESVPMMDEINKIYGDVYGATKHSYVFDASTLDPESVKVIKDKTVGWISVNAETLKNEKKIKVNDVLYDPARDSYNCDDKDYNIEFIKKNKCIQKFKSSSIRFGNILNPAQKNAPKVAKALQHLIKLCGGKPELF